ncbi:hypothetical protein E2C01_023438 [Portunus trituberculatus]|uniref:Uncharacterized protein n=1 Tax=Portunus trituberculatus TaxID=210409 RepID=A0A5B7E9U2_PORTR|nr:hypothetical protein [Portunus trituberculatus]
MLHLWQRSRAIIPLVAAISVFGSLGDLLRCLAKNSSRLKECLEHIQPTFGFPGPTLPPSVRAVI